jgi:hypothetical protein
MPECGVAVDGTGIISFSVNSNTSLGSASLHRTNTKTASPRLAASSSCEGSHCKVDSISPSEGVLFADFGDAVFVRLLMKSQVKII